MTRQTRRGGHETLVAWLLNTIRPAANPGGLNSPKASGRKSFIQLKPIEVLYESLEAASVSGT